MIHKYSAQNRNYSIFHNIYDGDINLITQNKIFEYRLLLISKDFGIYDTDTLEKRIIELINSGVTEFAILGKNASLVEKKIDGILVNLYLQDNKKSYLNIITLSENNIEEIENFLYMFYSGGFSGKNKNTYIQDNIIIIDNDKIENKILNFFKQTQS